ncbi:hypothetical protein HZA39_04070 [Candidatus Peregrinibacteria bacterium]|nr:hypothetical protein [Candidatus Peregrinibacteria bacterium]
MKEEMNILDFRTTDNQQNLEDARIAAQKLYSLIPEELQMSYLFYHTREDIKKLGISWLTRKASKEKMIEKLARQKNWETILAVQKAKNRCDLADILNSAKVRVIIDKPQESNGIINTEKIDYLSLIAFFLSDEDCILDTDEMKKLAIEILKNFSLTEEQK